MKGAGGGGDHPSDKSASLFSQNIYFFKCSEMKDYAQYLVKFFGELSVKNASFFYVLPQPLSLALYLVKASNVIKVTN